MLTACSDNKDAYFKKIVSCDLLDANFQHMKSKKDLHEAEIEADMQTTMTAEEFTKLESDLKIKAVQVEECNSYIKQHGRLKY